MRSSILHAFPRMGWVPSGCSFSLIGGLLGVRYAGRLLMLAVCTKNTGCVLQLFGGQACDAELEMIFALGRYMLCVSSKLMVPAWVAAVRSTLATCRERECSCHYLKLTGRIALRSRNAREEVVRSLQPRDRAHAGAMSPRKPPVSGSRESTASYRHDT
jgi:hypothetical protein